MLFCSAARAVAMSLWSAGVARDWTVRLRPRCKCWRMPETQVFRERMLSTRAFLTFSSFLIVKKRESATSRIGSRDLQGAGSVLNEVKGSVCRSLTIVVQTCTFVIFSSCESEMIRAISMCQEKGKVVQSRF